MGRGVDEDQLKGWDGGFVGGVDAGRFLCENCAKDEERRRRVSHDD